MHTGFIIVQINTVVMQGWCVPDRCVPDRKFLDVASLEQSVPWILYPWPMCPYPGSHKAGSTAAIRLPIGYRRNWPDLSRHKVGTHPQTTSPMYHITHGPHNAWVSRPRSWVKLGALRAPSLTATSLLAGLRAPSLTATSLLAGLNAWTASSMPGLWPLQY